MDLLTFRKIDATVPFGFCCCCWLFFLFKKSHYVAQDGHELTILLPQCPLQWDYNSVPPNLVTSSKS